MRTCTNRRSERRNQIMKTKPLYLDERQAAGMVLDEPERDYPRLLPLERRVCDIVAENLFLSKSSVQWAAFDSLTKGDDSGWKKIREKLMGRPVKLG